MTSAATNTAMPFVPEGKEDRDARCREILLIASLGLKQRLEHTGAKTAVVGLSGGLDSTLAVLITGLAMVVSHSSWGFISPRPLYRLISILALGLSCRISNERSRLSSSV